MELSNFLIAALRMDIVISDVTDLGWSWYNRERYAELTSLVDFECNFDKDGVCKLYQKSKHHYSGRRKAKKEIERISKCCCGGCRHSIGYLHALPNHAGKLGEIASLFDVRTGFWRLGTGCVLPRKYRSNTCLFHMCNRQRNRQYKPRLLSLLAGMMYTPCSRKFEGRRPAGTVFSKMFVGRDRSHRHRWVPYEKMEEMLKDEYRRKKPKR